MIINDYIPTSDSLISQIKLRLPEFLDKKRLNHTFFVEKEAITIAESVFLVYNEKTGCENDLRCAALLHDLTKQMPYEKQLQMCKEFSIPIDNYTSGEILHAMTSAHLAKKLFGINDIVFNAVFYHTTGKENMEIFEKIIFLADYIEETRTHEACVSTRLYFYENVNNNSVNKLSVLDTAVMMCLKNTLSFLIKNEKLIDVQTVKALNYLLHSNPKTNERKDINV